MPDVPGAPMTFRRDDGRVCIADRDDSPATMHYAKPGNDAQNYPDDWYSFLTLCGEVTWKSRKEDGAAATCLRCLAKGR